MANTKKGLGRGLNSLFQDSYIEAQPISVIADKKPAKPSAAKDSEEFDRVVYLKLSDIKPNSAQPRQIFNEEALQELADSIKEHGLIQPVIVRPANKGYELVAGERRWRASRKAGLKQIPAIIRQIDDKQNAFYALIENVQREDLSSIEEARGIKEIMDKYGFNQEDTAKLIGKSRPYVANSLRLLKLPEEIQTMVMDKLLSAGHARAIAGLKGEDVQLEVAKKAVSEGWSVRQIENYTGKTSGRKPVKRKAAKAADIVAVEESISAKLGTKAKINGSEKRGKIEIEYYSREDLDRILEIIS